MTELMSPRRRLVITALLFAVLLVLLLPYLWLILTSFKDRVDIFSGDPFAAFAPTLENYREAFAERGFLRNLVNSMIVAAGRPSRRWSSACPRATPCRGPGGAAA